MCLQQHVENKKLKRQSQMLLDRLNGVSKQQSLQVLVPDFNESTTADTNSSGTDDQISMLTNKINSPSHYYLSFSLTTLQI